MPRYTDDSKERVRDAVDMIDLIGTRVELRRAGADSYNGLCPFHDERTPSFSVTPSTIDYKVFSPNGDGLFDLLAHGNNAYQLWYGDGHGGFTPGPIGTFGTSTAGGVLAVADYNRDGLFDVAAVLNTQNIAVGLNVCP